MTRAKIKKIVSAALSAAMCCVVAGGAVTPVYAVQYNHVVMEEIPREGYKFELQNSQDGVIYGLFQIFSGRFGHDETTGQPIFLDGVDYVYGESHPDAGQPVSDEAKQQYLNDNSGYLDSIINQLTPIAILSGENPTYECGEGVYLWARAASDSTGGGTSSTGGSGTGGDSTGSGSVDIIWTDIEDAVVANPSISGAKVDGVSIAEHKDFYDENQTFYVPSMVTSAYDINTRTNIAKNDTKSTIIDEVQLSGLKEGQNYYLSSILMDKETGSQFIDGSGRTVSAVAWRKKGDSVWNYY